MDHFRSQYPIKLLCHVLRCSKSGYYQWKSAGRPVFKSFNTNISQVVLEQYLKDKRQGIVSLKMNIKKIYGLSISKKVIYRYMKLHCIQSIIRKKKKKYSKVRHHEIPNLIRRDFNAKGPNEKWSIDVTYIHTTYGFEYLYRGSCVDNVPIESWFSALKTECIYLNGKFDRMIARELISNYINYYNNERLQEQLKELTPYEYRILALA